MTERNRTKVPNSNEIILTESNYFSPAAEQLYMGTTQFKRFLSCEVQAMAYLVGEQVQEMTTPLLVGSYVDAHFSGVLDVFIAQHPEIMLKNGGLKADYEYANYIIARIEQDEEFVKALSGIPQQILTGEIEGVPVKIKVDSLLPERTVDLKIMRDFKDAYTESGGWQPFWKAWGYHYQGAIYQEIRRQNDNGQLKPFGIAAATKEKPEPDIGLFEIPQHELDAALEEVKANIVYFDGLKKGLFEPSGCGDCPVCRRNKKLKGWTEI